MSAEKCNLTVLEIELIKEEWRNLIRCLVSEGARMRVLNVFSALQVLIVLYKCTRVAVVISHTFLSKTLKTV